MNNMDAGVFNAFCGVLRDTSNLFDELIDFERKKIDAIAVNDIDLLEQKMNYEQAYLLKMKGLDQKREQLQEKLGFAGLSLKQLAEKCAISEKETLLAFYDELDSKSSELKKVIATAKSFVDIQVGTINAMLEKIDANKSTYTKDGQKTATTPPKRFNPRKV